MCSWVAGFLATIAVALAGAPAGSGSASAPAGPALVVHRDACAVLRSPDGLAEMRMLIDPEQAPDTPAYLGLATFQPGAAIAEHAHERSTEILYVLRGEGTMTLEGRALAVRAGDAVRIPAGALHSFRNTGKEPIEAIQLYVPPGPEARFRLWPPPEPATPRDAAPVTSGR